MTLRERLRRPPPMAALVVALLAVSTSAILIRLSNVESSSVKALYRVVFMAAIVAPVALHRNPGDFRRITRRDLLLATVTGVALAAHFAAWFESVDLTTVAASVTLVQTQPMFVAVGAYLLLGEQVTRRTVAGILVAFLGIVVMTVLNGSGGSPAPNPALGNSLAVVGAVCAAAYVLAGRSLRQRIRLFPYVTVVYTVCAATLLVFVLAQGAPLWGYPPREWVLFLAMAVVPGIFGHTVINWVLEHVESSVVSVSLLAEPVGSAVLALVVLSEVPDVGTVVGGAVVLVGIGVTTLSRETSESPPESEDRDPAEATGGMD